MDAQPRTESPQVADLLLRRGRLATLDARRSSATAAAIKDGRFVAVGTDEEVMAYRGDQTRVIDVGGRTVIPGQLADLAVLSTDYFAIPEAEISRLESVLTIVGGKVGYAMPPCGTWRFPT